MCHLAIRPTSSFNPKRISHRLRCHVRNVGHCRQAAIGLRLRSSALRSSVPRAAVTSILPTGTKERQAALGQHRASPRCRVCGIVRGACSPEGLGQYLASVRSLPSGKVARHRPNHMSFIASFLQHSVHVDRSPLPRHRSKRMEMRGQAAHLSVRKQMVMCRSGKPCVGHRVERSRVVENAYALDPL